jgi:alpha-tubulin suppressor-like RCC1 family protein
MSCADRRRSAPHLSMSHVAITAALAVLLVAGTAAAALAPAVCAAATRPALSAGAIHSLAVKSDGSLWSAGYAALGQLGRTPDASDPTNAFGRVTAAGPWTLVAGGFWHTLAVAADGTLWSWGDNQDGELGRSLGGGATSTATPGQVGSGNTWGAVASAPQAFFSIALMRDGTLWSWGSNGTGQLGLGSADAVAHATPAQIGGATDWASVACGGSILGLLGLGGHGLAIKRDGSLWSWGDDTCGQLGRTPDASNPAALPGRLGTDTDWVSVACGSSFSLGIKRDGSLWAWGFNGFGQLGNGGGDGAVHLAPERVGTATDWVTAACGAAHVVAIKANGELWSWGSNSSGQLGRTLGGPTWTGTPGRVGLVADWAAVAAGSEFTLALQRGGTLSSWGANGSGQLGDGTYADRTPPLQIVSLDAFAPEVAVQGAPSGWTNAPVTLTLLGTDDLSGVARIRSSLDGGATWSDGVGGRPAQVAMTATGPSTLRYYAVDNAGNAGAQVATTVRIDPEGPKTVALNEPRVRRGRKVTMRFRVEDLTSRATVTIKVYRRGVLKKTINVGVRETNVTLRCTWTCRLPVDRYTWKVYAVDLAGNPQRILGVKALNVK